MDIISDVDAMNGAVGVSHLRATGRSRFTEIYHRQKEGVSLSLSRSVYSLLYIVNMYNISSVRIRVYSYETFNL